MTVVRFHQVPSLRQRVSDEEWQARVDLAAAYRLVAHYGWTHLINNHISLRVPGTQDQFLINPYGLLYEQITASNLVKIDVDGNILDETPYQVNRAGFVIHSAIHMARKDLHAVLHTHTVAGQAVSALDCGLLPLNQSAMRFYKRIGYHDFEGVANDLDERERIVRDLGEHKCLILKHHGLLTAGSRQVSGHQLITEPRATMPGQQLRRPLHRLSGAVATLRVDQAHELGVDVPPLIDAGAQRRVTTYIERGEREGDVCAQVEVPAGADSAAFLARDHELIHFGFPALLARAKRRHSIHRPNRRFGHGQPRWPFRVARSQVFVPCVGNQ